MKLYYKALALMVLAAGSFGLIAPLLISAPSDIAVFGGLFYLVAVFPLAASYLVESIIKDIKK
jgi:hypothetical protein